MAGIGFELQKLFKGKGVYSNFKAYSFSSLVIIGPTVLGIFVVTYLNILMKSLGVPIREIELFQATLMYSYIFSLILTSGFSMMLSRYLSDRIYEKEYEYIMPSLKGALALIMIVGFLIGGLFYIKSPIGGIYKFFSYILFIELLIQMVLNTYVSALKNYKKITFSFFFGIASGILTGFILYFNSDKWIILSFIIAFCVAYFIMDLVLILEIKRYFIKSNNKYFGFIKYFKKHGDIFLTNSFWILGLYIDNFIFWTVPSINQIVADTYIYTPIYDIPLFFSFIGILPSMVIFVVKLETKFFNKYSRYFYLINNGAAYDEIEYEKSEMIQVLSDEVGYIIRVQFFFTIGTMVLGMGILPKIGFTNEMIDIFNIGSIAYYCSIIAYILVTILLYYEDKVGALSSMAIYFACNLIFTLITLMLGENYYGFGFFASSFLFLVVTLIRLNYLITNIDYYVFCKHSTWGIRKR